MSTTLTGCASSRTEPAAARWLFRLLEKLSCGKITLRCPDGRALEFSGAQPGPHATLTLADWQVCGDILSRGDIGLAEAYIIGADFIAGRNSALILGDNIFFGHDLPVALSATSERANGATVFAYQVTVR